MDIFQLIFASVALSSLYFVKRTVFVKPLVIWMLSYRCFQEKSDYGRYLGIGLILSSFGDIFLEMDDEMGLDLFIPGLISFLCAHLVYIYALREPFAKLFPLIGVVVGAYMYAVLGKLIPAAEPDLRIPVAVYGTAIGTMAFLAINRAFSAKYTMTSKLFALLGALTFVASDTVLAFNKFYSPIADAKTIVMLTYYAGQTLIAASCIESDKLKPKGK